MVFRLPCFLSQSNTAKQNNFDTCRLLNAIRWRLLKGEVVSVDKSKKKIRKSEAEHARWWKPYMDTDSDLMSVNGMDWTDNHSAYLLFRENGEKIFAVGLVQVELYFWRPYYKSVSVWNGTPGKQRQLLSCSHHDNGPALSINQSIKQVYCTEPCNAHTINLTNKNKREKSHTRTFIGNTNSTTGSSERALAP